MDSKFLRCPQCKGGLDAVPSGYRCLECDAQYETRHGVPLLISGVITCPSKFELTAELAEQILTRESIPDNLNNRKILQDIFSNGYQLKELLHTAENNFYLKRIGLEVDGYRVRHPLDDDIAGDVRYEFVTHMVPEVLPSNELRSWNVRLENTGGRIFKSKGEFPYFLTYEWQTETGEVLPVQPERTFLPVDIAAGRGITIPLWIKPPPVDGRYVLLVYLDQEEREWEIGTKMRLLLTVGPQWVSMVPGDWLTLHRTPDTYNYQIDHEIGRVFLKEELALGGHAYERVFEIGGCCNPMTWDLPCQVISADIDVQTLQVGALHFSETRPNIEFFASDAHNLPFVDGTFDCAVMFATLHHFLDPAACLRELIRVVKSDGFVAILCEPIGSYRAESLSEEFKADLEEGINEQIFTPEEYGQIFSKAGLFASRAMIDGGSFKAILRRVGSNKQSIPANVPTEVAAPVAMAAARQSRLKRAIRRIVRL